MILVMLASGCSLFKKRAPKPEPYKPHEPPVEYNFHRTPQADAKLFQTIGLDSFKEGNLAGAQLYLSKAVKSDDQLYLSWYYLGLLNINNQEGYSYLKKSAEIEPDFPLPYYWMAYYHCRVKEDQKAIPLFRKYIELAKGDPGEMNRLLAAREALQELESGKEGRALTMIRGI